MSNAGPAARRWLGFGLVASVVLALLALAPAPLGSGPLAGGAAPKFIGAAKCATCHTADEVGDQYDKWKSTGHAKAFEQLASDKAKEIAKAKGIDDPQKSDECLVCHVTGFGAPPEQLAKGFDPALGVQCESCHGAGEAHMKARVSAAGKAKDGVVAPVAPGEIVGQPTFDNCAQCHNDKSPTFKPFCFRKRNAAIVHPIPGKKHSPEEEKLLTSGCECGDDCKCTHGDDDPRCAGGGG